MAAGAALLVALMGGIVSEPGPWYYGLKTPDWQPPDWLFGPVWTLIYALTAMSGLLAWRAASERRQRDFVLVPFAFNAFLNVLWSLLFFRLQRPDWALAEVMLLWLSILWMVWAVRNHSRTAALLLVPYLLWVAFAGVLNAAIVALNGPFGGP